MRKGETRTKCGGLDLRQEMEKRRKQSEASNKRKKK